MWIKILLNIYPQVINKLTIDSITKKKILTIYNFNNDFYPYVFKLLIKFSLFK